MNQSHSVVVFIDLQKRLNACGLTLIPDVNAFKINDAPNSNGSIILYNLNEASSFVRGYELGYASSLTPL